MKVSGVDQLADQEYGSIPYRARELPDSRVVLISIVTLYKECIAERTGFLLEVWVG